MSADHSWDVALLATTEPGARNRRTVDSVLLLWAAIVIGLSAAIAASAPEHDGAVAQAFKTLLAWAEPLWRTAFVGLLVLAVLMVAEVLLRRRWDLARDLLVAAVVLAGSLAAVGVDESTAFAIALTHRLCTSYLPPIWGYFSLQWLGRKGYV
jgi:hypothetical protein